jgi:hypothetical protein
MSSFKLEKGSSYKQQAISAGALLILLGIIVFIAWYPIVGFAMMTLGIIAIIAGNFTSN